MPALCSGSSLDKGVRVICDLDNIAEPESRRWKSSASFNWRCERPRGANGSPILSYALGHEATPGDESLDLFLETGCNPDSSDEGAAAGHGTTALTDHGVANLQNLVASIRIQLELGNL